MEQIAYGPLALTPVQFWALTPREFIALLEGYRWRSQRQQELTAWAVAYLLQPYGFDGTPADLLKKPDMVAETAAADALLGVSQSPEEQLQAIYDYQRKQRERLNG